MASPKSKKISIQDQVFTVVNYIILTLIMLIVLYPLLYILSSSFSSPNAVLSGKVWLFPVEFTVMGYKLVFQSPDIMRSFANTVFYTILGTSINIVVTIMCAYPLARKTFYGRGVFTAFITFTMLFGGGLIPSFLLIKNLNMYNTIWALFIPGCVSVYNVVVARTFFQTNIPDELYEAGQLDGASDIRFLISVVLPLSTPILAVLTMFFAVGHWNSYFSALIYLTDKDLYPLQIVLKNILTSNVSDSSMLEGTNAAANLGVNELLKYSVIVVSSTPMLILYPFVQKHFVKGMMVGAIKG